ncbi:DUF2802 domain-containing protein [Motilimonas pumila]|uniref:DUF2802 domain-containing protein n=1 Tax=Motilimonas pumila TaxID=2303987 RepID=UPI001314FF05|nr:DUF2802 domain-containing protein [Motilimonas pumila]
MAIVAIVFCFLWHKSQQKKIQALEEIIKELIRSKDNLTKQVNELHVGSVGLGKKVFSLNSTIRDSLERQQELVAHDPDSKLYTRAVKMVELGADLEEVMRECDLPRAEAELLLNLHAKAR